MDFFKMTMREKVHEMRRRRSLRVTPTGEMRFRQEMRFREQMENARTRKFSEESIRMPCDIHVMVEVKHAKAATWMAATSGTFYVTPDYTLFALLAGVRAHSGIEPLVKPRGLPPTGPEDKISPDTEAEYAQWDDFAHDQGWLTPEEWIAACVSARLKTGESCVEALAIGNMAKAMAESERYTAARLVFWFNS